MTKVEELVEINIHFMFSNNPEYRNQFVQLDVFKKGGPINWQRISRIDRGTMSMIIKDEEIYLALSRLKGYDRDLFVYYLGFCCISLHPDNALLVSKMLSTVSFASFISKEKRNEVLLKEETVSEIGQNCIWVNAENPDFPMRPTAEIDIIEKQKMEINYGNDLKLKEGDVKDLKLALCGRLIENKNYSSTNAYIRTGSKSFGILQVIIFMGFIAAVLGNCIYENVDTKTIAWRQPFCPNVNHTTSNGNYTIYGFATCLDSQFTGKKFELKAYDTAEISYIAETGALNNVTSYKWGCKKNGLRSEYCDSVCDINTMAHISLQNRTAETDCNSTNYNYYFCKILHSKCFATTGCICEPYSLTDINLYFPDDVTKCNGSLTVIDLAYNDTNTKLLDYPANDTTVVEFIEFDGKTIKTRTKKDCDCYLKADKGKWSKSVGFESRFATIVVDDVALMKSGHLYVQIVDRDGGEDLFDFYIIGSVYCRINDCILCWSAFKSFGCLPTSIKVLFWSILAAMILLCCCLFPFAGSMIWVFFTKVLKITKCLVCCPFSCLRVPIIAKMRLYFARKWEEFFIANNQFKEEQSTLPLINPVGDTEVERIRKIFDANGEQTPVKSRSSRLTMSGIEKTMLLILILAPLAMAQNYTDWGCSTVTVTEGSFTNCVDDGTKKTCDLAMDVEITMPFSKSKACITVTDDTSGKVAWFEISYLTEESDVTLSTIYYTSAFYAKGFTSHRCYGSGSNCLYDRCANSTTYTRTANGELIAFDELTKYPGITDCRRGCGCAACGCFYCVDGCIYRGYSIIPMGKGAVVQKPVLLNNRPYIAVNYTDRNGSKILETRVDLLIYNIDKYRFEFDGSFQSDFDFLDGQKVINDGNYTWFQEASELNEPECNTVGDIQAGTTSLLDGPNANFEFNGDCFTWEPQFEKDELRETAAGYYKLREDAKFPLKLGGDIWTYNDNHMLTNKTAGGGISFTLILDGTFSVTMLSTSVCPKVDMSYHASGCFNCDEGFTINVTLWSVCLPGVVEFLSSEDYITLDTTSDMITDNHFTYEILGSTTQQDNDFDLIIVGETNVSIRVAFTAVAINDVITNETFVYDYEKDDYANQGKMGDFKKYFDKAFWGTGAWHAYIILGVIATLTVSLIIFLAKRNTGTVTMLRESYSRVRNKMKSNKSK